MLDLSIIFLLASISASIAIIAYRRSGLDRYFTKSSTSLLGSRQGKCHCNSKGCIGLVEVIDSTCLKSSGLPRRLSELAGIGSINGVMIFFRPVDRAKIIKSLEAKIIELKILLERRPGSKLLEEKIELLSNLLRKIRSGRAPLESTLALAVQAYEQADCERRVLEVLRILESEGCHVRSLSYRSLLDRFLPTTAYYELDTEELVEEFTEVLPWITRPSPTRHGVYIGSEIGTSRPVFLSLWDQGALHTIVVGPTGKGKSTLLALIALRSLVSFDNVRIWVFDPKGDLSLMLSSYSLVKVLGGHELYQLLRFAHNKGMPLAYIISMAAKLGYNDVRNIERLLRCDVSEELIGLREKLRALGIYIDEFCRFTYSESIHELGVDEGILVIDLSSLNDVMRNIMLWVLLFIVLDLARGDSTTSHHPRSLNTILVIDEAWRLKSGPSYIMHRLFKEGRSLGVAVVLASQDPSDIPEEAWNNAGNIIAFGSPDKDYLTSLAKYMMLSEDYIEKAKWLRRGEAIIRSPYNPIPLLITVDAEPRIVNAARRGYGG
ncbi:MAG: ATP-binding protein [Pyrodictiaceae archaeon]